MSNYKTTKECRALTGITTPDLVKLCTGANVDYYVVSKSKDKYRINIKSLMEYMKHNDVPIGAFRNIKMGTYTLVSGYDHKYAINNDTGDVVNFDNGRVLTPSPNKVDGNLYYQVSPIKDGEKQAKLVHRFILEAGLLPNNRNCDNVHHIDGNTANNRPSNLLPTFSGKEHSTLDRLRKDQTKKKYYMQDSSGTHQVYCIESGVDFRTGDDYVSASGTNSRYFQNLPTTAQIGIMEPLFYESNDWQQPSDVTGQREGRSPERWPVTSGRSLKQPLALHRFCPTPAQTAPPAFCSRGSSAAGHWHSLP